MKSKQQRLVEAIAESLKMIKVVNGFKTDVPDTNIFIWLPVEMQTSRLPSISLSDISSEWEHSARNLYFRTQIFQVVGMVSGDHAAHAALRDLQSDLVRALYNDARGWGGLVEDSWISASEMLVVQQEKAVAGVRLTFNATFYHSKKDDAADR